MEKEELLEQYQNLQEILKQIQIIYKTQCHQQQQQENQSSHQSLDITSKAPEEEEQVLTRFPTFNDIEFTSDKVHTLNDETEELVRLAQINKSKTTH